MKTATEKAEAFDRIAAELKQQAGELRRMNEGGLAYAAEDIGRRVYRLALAAESDASEGEKT